MHSELSVELDVRLLISLMLGGSGFQFGNGYKPVPISLNTSKKVIKSLNNISLNNIFTLTLSFNELTNKNYMNTSLRLIYCWS